LPQLFELRAGLEGPTPLLAPATPDAVPSSRVGARFHDIISDSKRAGPVGDPVVGALWSIGLTRASVRDESLRVRS